MHFGRNAITHSWNQAASSRSRQENFLHDEYLPYAWDPRTLEWTAAEIHNAQRLDPETVVKVTSWYLGDIPGGRKGSRRTFAAMDCLRQKFGELPTQTVVMLQEVTRHLHRHILENLWVQHNFQLSNVLPRKGREMGFNKDTVKVGMNEGDPSGPRVYLDKFLYSKSLETVALCEDEIVGTMSLRDAGETPAEV